MRRLVLALACLAILAPAARADAPSPFGGLRAVPGSADLPPPLPAEGCVALPQQRLSRAADEYRRLYANEPVVTQSVGGLRLTDSAKAIGYLRRSLGRKAPQTFDAAVQAACRTVRCALEKTLGDEEAALWFLVAAAELDAPPSLDQSPYTVESVWEQHELRALARSLMEIPPELRNSQNLKVWRRLPSGETLHKGGAKGASFYNAVSYLKDAELFGLGTIVIRDTVWKMPQRNQRAVVFHELGHEWEYTRKAMGGAQPSLGKEWLSLSQWRSKSGGHGEHDYSLPDGVQIGTAGEGMPTEDFADSIANYRFLPRLLRAYSEEKYDYMKRFYGGREYLKPRRDPELEQVWKGIGGPLESMRKCAAFIQRATFGPGLHQHELYTVTPKGTSTHWEPILRSNYVIHAGCVERTLQELEAAQGYDQVMCRQDPEDVAVAVADRLEDVWASFSEAAEQIARAVPASVAEGCLERRDLTSRCYAGPTGFNVAEREAFRILDEYGGDHGQAQELAKTLLAQTPLVPKDDEVRERIALLKSTPDLLYACLAGAAEISPKPEGHRWTYWVKLPPTNEVRGFPGPIWNAACQRDFVSHARAQGLVVEDGDKLFEHFAYLLKLSAGPLVDRFASGVLSQAGALRSRCGIAGNGKIGNGQSACAASWLKPRLDGLAPPELVDQLAQRLVGNLKAR